MLERATILSMLNYQYLRLLVSEDGIKPLFWTVAKGRLLVAAEMKNFRRATGVKFERHVRCIAASSYEIGYATTFQNTEKVTFQKI